MLLYVCIPIGTEKKGIFQKAMKEKKERKKNGERKRDVCTYVCMYEVWYVQYLYLHTYVLCVFPSGRTYSYICMYLLHVQYKYLLQNYALSHQNYLEKKRKKKKKRSFICLVNP